MNEGKFASTLPDDDDMTHLQGTKSGAAVTGTYSDNHTLKSHLLILTTNQKRIGSGNKRYFFFPRSVQICIMFVNMQYVSFGRKMDTGVLLGH